MEEKVILRSLRRIEEMIGRQLLFEKPLLNFREACQYLGISPSLLKNLLEANKIPHFCPGKKGIYFEKRHLGAWVRQRKKGSWEQQARTFLLQLKDPLINLLVGLIKMVVIYLSAWLRHY